MYSLLLSVEQLRLEQLWEAHFLEKRINFGAKFTRTLVDKCD